jgi:adenine-specific DNA-methyltransferase
MRIINSDDIFESENKESLYYYTENNEYLTSQLITYIGNKRKLLEFIRTGIKVVQKSLSKNKISIFDGFSGSGITSRYFKGFSTSLYCNDLELYSEILNKCYLSNVSDLDLPEIAEKIREINDKSERTDLGIGLIEKLYSPKDSDNIKKEERVFYTNQNAKIIDNSIRLIKTFSKEDQHLCIAPLLIRASVHVNTSGVFKGFYKDSKGIGCFGGDDKNCLERITKKIVLPVPVFSKHECDVNICRRDVNEIVKELPVVDLAYYDPPYNQHPYGSNYFMLNLIAEYKRPKNISKVSGIPDNWQKSVYNIKTKAEKSFDNLIKNTKAKFILVSYNNEGFISMENMNKILSKYGEVEINETAYNAFRGSRNLKNRSNKVKEILFILKK